MSSSLITRGIFPIDYILQAPVASRPKKGMRLVNLLGLGIVPGIAGGAAARGTNSATDLVTQTSDGFDLNLLWDEFQATMALQNAQRTTMVNFLTFSVTTPTERVPQISSADFEKSSEFGEPVGVRPTSGSFKLGYDLDWYDLAARFTWKFLADAPASQVEAINSMAIEADNRLIFSKVLDALYNPANRFADINGEQDVNVYALYNGDGTVPPTYKSNTFTGTHTHYLTSGAAVVDSTDLDDMIEHLEHHGYNLENGMRLMLLTNRRDGKAIRKFRVSAGSTWDFIPAQGSPGLFLPEGQQLLGGQVANNFAGLNVSGSYGPLVVIEEDYAPAGYIAAIATGGTANLNNPVGLREHANPSLRGLRLVKGPSADYPLIDSFYNRGFGTGIRQRGGSVVMQLTANATYTKPTIVA